MSGPLTRPGDAAGDSPVRIGAGTPASGSGDVVGPASSTDNFFALADGTTGKLIKFFKLKFAIIQNVESKKYKKHCKCFFKFPVNNKFP